ncbi:MAG: FAD-dependent oxidoreductase [Methanoregula sp.]|nr:FAD-dependent oxidoreductase [Methanoregula sp.]
MEFVSRVIESVSSGSSVSVRFERPRGLTFLPGQYIILTVGTGTSALTKSLTLSGSPNVPYFEVTKGLTGHPFADALLALKAGDEIHASGPFGDFTFIGEYKKVAFIAGGIGLTPLWSMTRYATEMMFTTEITLLYSARTEDRLLFRHEMRDLTERNPHLSIVLTLTAPGPGWNGRTGRIDRRMIEQELPDWRDRVFFASGPPGMVDAILAILREIGIPESQIRFEYFPGP